MIYYFGDVTVKYDNLEMKAAYMAYDVEKKTVFARGQKDTAGVLQGKPEMSEGGKTYTMEEVTYNFESKKAQIKNMITQEAEGFLHGHKLKKMADNSVNISDGKYTACDLDHPHYYLKMPVAKVVTGENPVTVFGPAYFVLEDVPTPFALPFGFVPKQSTRSGGLLIPSYGEELSRGFFLQGLGYYFVLGDNFDASITTDIYSLGSWNMKATSRYKKRYRYSGDLNFNFSNNQVGERGGADFFQSKDFSVQWSHSMDAKARPGTTFRASVNFSSPLNNRFNNYNNIQSSLQNQISSSISYSRTWAGTPFSFSTNALHSQNSLDSSYAITFPNITFVANNIKPFKRTGGTERFYEKFAFSYNTTLENKINFKAKEVGQPDFLSKFRSGMKHSFSITLPDFSLLKYLKFVPSVNYGMNWYFQKSEKVYNSQKNIVEDKYSDLFKHFGVTQDFSAALSANTTVYGIYDFGKKWKLRKIRHLMKPSVSFAFRPEMATPWNGYTNYSYIDNNGVQHVIEYNKYQGQLYAPPSRGRSAAIGFSLGNNVEAKIRDENDTTTGESPLKLIDNLSIGGSYNFIADSLNLSNINISMNTTIFGKLGLSANAVLDPYAVDGRGRKINQFNIAQKGGLNLARLVNASVSFSYQLGGEAKSGKGNTGQNSSQQGQQGGGKGSPGPMGGVKTEQMDYTKVYYHPVTGEYIPGGWVYYLEPNYSWSVNLNYNYSYGRSYLYANERLQTVHNHMQTLGVAAQVRFTKALNMNLNTGIDMMKMTLTTTQLSATYDLHCFQISVSWVPSGQWQSWSFRINAKASALADLLQFKKNASYWDN